MNPFKRITYTEQERERSKEVWKMFHDFCEELETKTPSCHEKTLVKRKRKMNHLRLFTNWVLLLTMPIWVMPFICIYLIIDVFRLFILNKASLKLKTGEKWMWE